MGFSGGGTNVTKAHTHSGAIVQDGGALNFDNVTQASLAAGDITYSDGAALQVLGIGSATDTLTVNAGATAPEWVAPAASASPWTSLETQTDGDTFQVGEVGGSLFASSRFIHIIGQYRGSPSSYFACTMYNSTTTITDYDQVYMWLQDSTYTAPATTGVSSMTLGYAENNNTCFFDISFPVSVPGAATHGQLLFRSCGSANNTRNWFDGVSWINNTDDLAGINWSAGNIVTGSCSYEVLGLA